MKKPEKAAFETPQGEEAHRYLHRECNHPVQDIPLVREVDLAMSRPHLFRALLLGQEVLTPELEQGLNPAETVSPGAGLDAVAEAIRSAIRQLATNAGIVCHPAAIQRLATAPPYPEPGYKPRAVLQYTCVSGENAGKIPGNEGDGMSVGEKDDDGAAVGGEP